MSTIRKLREIAKKNFPEARITLVHLLTAWAREDPGGELKDLLKGSGISAKDMAKLLSVFLDKPSEEDKQLLISCIIAADKDVRGIDLIQQLCQSPDHRLTKVLTSGGMICQQVIENIHHIEQESTSLSTVGVKMNNRADPIQKYGRNLTELAEEGYFTELCPRPEEINRLTDILLRKRKGNPVLTGPAGIGKTALVELLARDIAEGKIEALTDFNLFEVSMGKLVAGTKYRGEFEARFEEVMESLKNSSLAILFIDEFHMLVGAGKAEGVTMDGANLLKPYIARDDFRVVGATTGREYHKYISGDRALTRRFQEIRIKEPSGDTLYSMVSRQVEVLNSYHNIEIPKYIIKKSIELSDKYLTNRYQPDKSIDLLDTTAVAVRKKGSNKMEVNDLLDTLSSLTGTPIGILNGEDRDMLTNLTEELKKSIIGQDQAVELVVKNLMHRRMNFANDERPLGVFLFAGDTGVGKTELARTLAEAYFGNKDRLIHIDLSEYSTQAAVHKMIGAPAGLIGYENEGILIKGLQDNPASVILLDEIEKAHPDIYNLLLGLLDNGRISSSRGETYDARQSIIIMTTNALRNRDLKRSAVGFNMTESHNVPFQILNEIFPEEFLGRIDEIIPFNKLHRSDYLDIARLRMKETRKKLNEKGISLRYDEEKLLDYLLEELKTDLTGARGLDRVIERKLLRPLAYLLLQTDSGKEMIVTLDNGFYRTGEISAQSL